MSVESGTGLRVLVTSGGTSEKIDQVRTITNMSTGRLGSLIADAFTREGGCVTYLCGEGSLLPSLPVRQVHTVGGVRQLMERLELLLGEQQYDCVVHSMAVSDYTVRTATTARELAREIAQALARESVAPGDTGEERLNGVVRAAIGAYVQPSEKKISSNLEDMVLLMEKTPKVIGRIKELQPETTLVGFKLLAGVSEEELVRVARELMARSRSDFVLANDLEGISGDRHKAVLVCPNGGLRHLDTKQEIARAIVESVLEEKGRRKA